MNLLSIFTPQQDFPFGKSHVGSACIINANQINKNEAWIEIKEVLLKHFLPDNYQKLILIRQQLIKLKDQIQNLEIEYNNSITTIPEPAF
jgi:protein-arginine kinase activator protein McsA